MKKYNVRNYNENDLLKFNTSTKSEISISAISNNSDFDWVEVFEEYMPYLDNIIRNPRRFIQSDESLVPIEKAKKFTEESIKHLAQNTQLIQDIDKDGMPQPLKVLNVYKEETYDLYENRFIHSLVENLHYFLTYRLDELKNLEATINSNGRTVNYKSISTMKNSTFETDLNIKLIENENKIDIDIPTLTDKVENMYAIIVGFKATAIMKELERAEPVRSPIRKTNAILKDPDLNKCLELWEILEKLLNNLELEKSSQNNQIDNQDEYLTGLNLTNYLNYCILTDQNNEEEQNIELNAHDAFEQIIKQYIRKKEVTINNFKDTIVKDFNEICKHYVKEYYEVNKLYDKALDSYNELLSKDIFNS